MIETELELAGTECLASLPALHDLIVSHVYVGVPCSTDRTDDADGGDRRDFIGHFLQVNLNEVEACIDTIDVRTAFSGKRTASSIAADLLPVAIPVVLVRFELELTV